MKTAAQSVGKWSERTSAAALDYTKGAQETSKDQNALAINAEKLYQSEIIASFARNARVKGLQAAGKQGWLDGVIQKGGQNFQTGVASQKAQDKYAQNSGRYDQARQAAANVVKGPKGSAVNLGKVTTVATALRLVKTTR